MNKLAKWEGGKLALLRANWRVVYPDGHVSRPMSYKNALAYAGMFKGAVTPTSDPILDVGMR